MTTKTINIDCHLGLARAIARKFTKQTPIEDSEEYSVACIGLVKASIDYDESKNVSFASFAWVYMKREILAALKKNNRTIKGCDANLYNVPVKTQPEPIDIIAWLADNNCKYKPILIEYFVKQKSVQDIAKKKKCTRQNIYSKINIGIQDLKEKFYQQN